MKSFSSQMFPLALAVLTLAQSTLAQVQATGSSNGIVSAAGTPLATPASYSIQGSTPISTSTSSTSSNIGDAAPIATSQTSSVGDEKGLSVPAILGITLGVVMIVVAIGAFTIYTYLHKRQEMKRQRDQVKRKSIMDLEFAASKIDVQQIGEKPLPRVSKPLPAITDLAGADDNDDTLSRSSTIIADAAEIAKINRKASTHQKRQKQKREMTRERNHALHVLITNEHGVTSADQSSVLDTSPTTLHPQSPASPLSPTMREGCTDNDGDAFSHRPSKF